MPVFYKLRLSSLNFLNFSSNSDSASEIAFSSITGGAGSGGADSVTETLAFSTLSGLAFESSSSSGEAIPEMPFPECGAMSQGYIGFHLQNAIQKRLAASNLDKSAATVVTQVLVSEEDEAFKNPTKPVGSFYTREEANKLTEEKDYIMVEDSGRGYRRVVPSPLPLDIVEKKLIKKLVDDGDIVIACGGGGIPVVRRNEGFEGVPAVIDKDFACETLAELVEADTFLILTAVDQVAINFGEENEKWLSNLSLNEAQNYCDEGHFAAGSMLPKVKAAMNFVKETNGRAIITSLEKAADALEGKAGTVITE